jgi:CelD/BcsL family acetyltransferase involved in cellulose biosynthesis
VWRSSDTPLTAKRRAVLTPVPATAFKVFTLTAVDQLLSMQAEWLDLLKRAKLDLPFIWPEWVIAWWELFRQQRLVIRDNLQVKTVRRDSGELVAIFPMMMTTRPAVGPARVRSIGFLGADNYLTEQQTPIVDPAWQGEVAEALAADLQSDRTWDWVAWEGLQPKSPLTRRLEQLLELRWTSSQPENILHLAQTWEQFRLGLKRHVRDSLRHCYNSLRTEGLTAHLDIAAKPDEIRPALDIFFRLHSAIAQYRKDPTRPDRFAEPIAQRFLIELYSRFADRNRARIFSLRIGGVPVASQLGFLLQDCLYLYYAGYDPAWRKFSVGTTITAEAIKYAITSGIPRLHLSMGADLSKSRWGPEMRLFCRAVCVRRGLYSRAAFDLYSRGRAHTGPLKGILGRR